MSANMLMQKKYEYTDIAYVRTVYLQTFGIQLAMFIIKFAVTTLNNGAQIFMHRYRNVLRMGVCVEATATLTPNDKIISPNNGATYIELLRASL